jgi:nanoRNase/pAp phosphatase (c-di-AMP/oligoRNAs hydrolase)
MCPITCTADVVQACPVEEDGLLMNDRLAQLLESVRGAGEILILPHNDPDPDAIAAALALQHLLVEKSGVKSTIAYKGIIGRAENRALVRYLGYPLQRLSGSDLRQARPIALVDTQPGTGNNALPAHVVPALVFDHHPWREATAAAPFADVRVEMGATSTLLVEYLRAAGIEPAPPLATALFYGIKTDTMGLIRGASPEDVAAYLYLQPRIDVEALVEIERAQVPAEYFVRLDAALHAARVYDSLIVSYVGPMHRPDLAAEMADLLLRLQGVRWAVCMGVYKGGLILAVRSQSKRIGAGQLVQAIVGDEGTAGGHGTMAGGHVPLRGKDPEALADQLGKRALQHLSLSETAASKPLLA